MIKNRWKGKIVPKLIIILLLGITFCIIAGSIVQAANPPSGYTSVLDGTISKGTDLTQPTGVNFRMDYSACSDYPTFSSDNSGFFKDGRFIVYTMPNDSNFNSIPGTLTITYANAAVDSAGTRYDLKFVINNIVINGYKKSNAKNKKLRLFAISNTDKTPWVEAYADGVTLQNAMKYMTYDVTMSIVNKQGATQSGTFVFALKDVDISCGNGLGYGDYSEGATLLSGFTLSSLRVRNDSLLCYKWVSSGVIRLTGTEKNSDSDRDPTGVAAEKAGFSVIASASGAKFKYSGGINCGTGICDGGQATAIVPRQAANNVSVSGKSLTYNGSSQGLVTVSNSKGTMSYSVNGGAWSSSATATNAGTYTIDWKDAGNSSYLPASGRVTTTIAKINNTLTLSATSGTTTYGTTSKTFTITKNTSGGALSVSDNHGTATSSLSGTTVTIGSLGSIGAGTSVKVTVTSAATTNYNSATATYTLTINKAANPATGSAKTGLVYNGNDQVLASVSNAQGAVTYTINGGSAVSSPKGKNAGTYTVVWTAAGNSNYNSKSGTLSVSIAKAANPATASAVSNLVYNGSAQTVITVSNAQGAVTYTNGPKQTNAGTYSVGWTAAGNSNYNSKSGTVSATIAKRSFTKPTIASNPTYSGVEQTASLNNFNSGAMNVSDNKRTNVGTQNVKVSLKDTANNMWADKSTSELSLSWTINKKSVAVVWNGPYTFTYNKQAQGPAVATPLDGVNGEKLNITRTTATNVGSYTSTASLSSVTGGQAKTDNYTITNTTANYKIEKLKLAKPTQVNKTYTYNKSEQTFELNGFDSNTMSITGNKRTNAGQQTVTVALKDKSNYGWQTDGNTTDVTFTFKINKAPCTITPSPSSMIKINEKNIPITYTNKGEENVPVSYTYTGDGVVTVASSNTNLATVSINTTDRKVTITRVSTLNSGTLTVTINGAEGNNYLATSATVNVTVKDVIPKITKVHINGDASTTKNFDVVVSLDTTSENPLSYVHISEDNTTPGINYSGWLPYNKHSIFRLSLKNGSKKLYVWVKDAYDNVSLSTDTANVHNHTASINLDARYTAKVKCNQTGTSPEAYTTYYAIKEAGAAYSTWQTGDEFKGLLAYKTYLVKTKIVYATGVERESKECKFSVSYDNTGKLILEQ